MKLTFLGAAQTVTGSRILLEHRNKKYLIDCGLYQGPKEFRDLNWQTMKVATDIDAVILTHAHIDHSGYLPKLIKDGFRGKIIATKATVELCKIMLPDSGRLQEEDALFANKTGHSHHQPAYPLYTEKDAFECLRHFQSYSGDDWLKLDPNCSVRFLRSGHILGSAIVQFSLDTDNGPCKITFSGDLGNGRSFLLKDPIQINETDFLILESTYGDRIQPKTDIIHEIEMIVKKVLGRGGTLIIPSFAVGRTQDIIYILDHLETQGKIPSYPVYVDSPMAEKTTDLYELYDEDLKLNDDPEETFSFKTNNFRAVADVKESIKLCLNDDPKIIISAAGMLTGGRVLHHLKAHLPDSKCGVLFVGYQAEGTKGRLLKDGLKKLRIHHKEVDVNAEIFSLDSLSAHADAEDLVKWVNAIDIPPQNIFLNHGEIASLQALKEKILTQTKVKNVVIPHLDESFQL